MCAKCVLKITVCCHVQSNVLHPFSFYAFTAKILEKQISFHVTPSMPLYT